jgi:hypothetical protein
VVDDIIKKNDTFITQNKVTLISEMLKQIDDSHLDAMEEE